MSDDTTPDDPAKQNDLFGFQAQGSKNEPTPLPAAPAKERSGRGKNERANAPARAQHKSVEEAADGKDVEPQAKASRKRQNSSNAAGAVLTGRSTARPDRSTQPILVRADHLCVHPSQDIDENAFEATYMDDVAAAREQLQRGITSPDRPRVIRLDDGRFGAVSHFDTVVAAMRLAAEVKGLQIAVLLVDAVADAQTVVEQLGTPRSRSGWEQHQAISAIFAGRPVRETLQRLELDIGRWETRVSKVLKIGRLPPEILERVVLLTIPTKEAGHVVDAWEDQTRRPALEDVLADAAREGNARVPAPDLFKRLIAAGKPQALAPTWADSAEGIRVFATADGTVLATMTLVDDRWTASGMPMSAAQWREFGREMPKSAT